MPFACALALAAPRAAPGQPPPDYARAVAAIARRQAADDRVAVRGARSILLTQGAPAARVIVLLHGLTDSPQQFEVLARRLHADGNNVFVPRFPHHGLRGGSARSLAALKASELRTFADSVVREATGLGDSVVVAGLSLGGTVAGWIAQRHVVWRAVLIAPALEPGRVPPVFDRLLVWLVAHLPDVVRRGRSVPARPDLELGVSTRAVAEVLELGESVLREAKHEPPRGRHLVLLLNAHDRTVRESAAESLARRWARHGAVVSVLELPDSLRLPHNVIDARHGPTMDPAMLELVRRLASGEPPSTLARARPVR